MDTLTPPDLLRYRDLGAQGLTRYQFERMIDDGEYERIAPGLFLRAGITDDTTAAWIAIAAKRSESTICLLSALALHDLTDEIPTRSDIAVPRGAQPLTVRLAPIAWHRFDADTFQVGRTDLVLPGGVRIGLYTPERTIVDLFRLRHLYGGDLAILALKRWLPGRGHSPAALLAVAADFPKARPGLSQALEVLL